MSPALNAGARRLAAGIIVGSLVLASPAHGVEWLVEASPAAGPATDSSSRGPDPRRFATLEKALDALKDVRNSREALPVGGIVIRLAPGVHRTTGPLLLGDWASGEPEAPVSITGPADRTAVISGAKALGKPAEVTDARVLERLPVQSRGRVVQFSLRDDGIAEWGPLLRRGFGRATYPGQLELFFRGKPMTQARWPNVGYATLSAASPESGDRAFRVSGANLERLAQEPHLMATGYWGRDWADETIRVESVNPGTGEISMEAPAPRFGIAPGQRVFLQNALSELDAPGEWYLDRMSGIVYFWPPEPIREGDVQVSVAPALIVIEGASHLRFSGITLEMSRGDALVVQGGRDIHLRQVTIRNIGGRAARVEGTAHRLIDLDVHDIGEGGVYLSGGDRTTLVPGDVSVEYSRFRGFNRLARTYRPAVYLSGVGNRAVGNVISEGTHSAIIFNGNEHLIAFNDIGRVALETGDVGAIYTGRDWSARGTVIRDNFLHDIRGVGRRGSIGVYLDDQASGISVRRNLFVRVDRPILVGGGRDNRIEENVIVSGSPAIHVDARGLAWQREMAADPEWGLLQSLSRVPFDRSPYRERYPNLASIFVDEPGAPKYNVVRNNIVIDSRPLQFLHGAERWVEVTSLIEAGPELLEGGPAALRGDKPGDFALSGAASLPAGAPALPLPAMDCVRSRWREADAGRAAPGCAIH